MRFFPFLLCVFSIAFTARLPYPFPQSLSLNISQLVHQAEDSDNVPAVPPEFNINSGGPASGRFVAESDQWIVGHTSAYIDDDAVIGGAEEKNLVMYKSHRYGVDGAAWGYNILVMEPGTYGCTIHFAETNTDAFFEGARVFDLNIATSYGEPHVFFDIDIYKELDRAQFTVLTKTVVDLVIPGYLYIRVKPSVGDAIISGVTCERTGDLPDGVDPDYSVDPNIPVIAVGSTDKPDNVDGASGALIVGTEININAGGPELGRFVAEDYAWIFGTTSFWEGPKGVEIGGAEEKNAPALVSQRYGVDGSTWGYRIPIQIPGLYACSLHFAETDSASFAIGARVFNVRIQDSVLENIDVYRESGEAAFTSVVKTFQDLEIGRELYIELSAVTGDAFLSAITCERTAKFVPEESPGSAPLRLVPEELQSKEPTPSTAPQIFPSPSSVLSTDSPASVAETPIVGFPVEETPGAEASNVGILIGESPSAETLSIETPMAHTPVTESPIAETSTEIQVIETPAAGAEIDDVMPSPIPSMNNEEPVPGADKDGVSVSASPTGDSFLASSPSSSASPFPLDERLTAEGDEGEEVYELLGAVANGGEFTVEMKDVLITLSRESTEEPSKWALISLQEQVSRSAVRLLLPFGTRQEGDRVYEIDLQAIHKSRANITTASTEYAGYINNDINNDLKEREINDLTVKLRNSPVLESESKPDVSNTSTIVGIVVGCILAALILIALIAFFVVRRSRSGGSVAGFDAPPPMTESEMSSVIDRSETAASTEYLDDDSTFTAATSRAGDNPDQVAIDKDIFGRGNAPPGSLRTS